MDCNYTFPNNLEPNGILFGAKSNRIPFTSKLSNRKNVITIKIRFDSTRFGKRFLGERFFTVQLCMLTEIDFAVLFDLTVCDCIDHFPFDLRSLLLSKQKRKIDNAITVRSIWQETESHFSVCIIWVVGNYPCWGSSLRLG